jgi:ABC-2 type transport system permease protein
MSDIVAPAPGPAARRATRGPSAVLADPLTMIGRCLRLSRRNVESLITSLMLPVMLMLMFVYLFGGAIHTGTAYVTYVVPGVLLVCAGFGAATTAVTVSHDMAGGIIDRFRSLDLGGPVIIIGHVAAGVVRNAASTLVVFGVAFLIGFRADARALAWLAAAGVLLAFMIAFSALFAAVGLFAKSPEAASGFAFLPMFLPYASSAFVPIDTMPTWLRGFAGNQPVTSVIQTVRGLLQGTPVGASPWIALAWCSGILLASIASATLLFRLRTR